MITMNLKPVAILLNLLLLTFPASASYAGDKPLQTIIHDENHGGLDFSLGDSKYSGELAYNKSYMVNFSVNPPSGSSIKVAKAYVYWVWSKKDLEGIYPQFNASIISSGNIESLPEGHMYTDTKGFVSRYDYFSGMNAYDLSGKISKPGNYSISLMNTDKNGSTFCVQGIGLLLAYEDPKSPTIEYWINEGCDMLYADYGITPEVATMTTYFKGDINPDNITDAQLITVSPSGGYSSGREARNKLFFNEETSSLPVLGDIIQLLFGSGKSWENVYQTNDTVQVALDEKPVGDYLVPTENFVSIQDEGDYLLATNAILVLNLEEPESSEKRGI
ncbi:cell surface protein [Methanosarcina barkeri CM1]|uniref:Cell surface protein n=3 Tax=Methanosarcina barkeri TaxID=2208 RepID=A0A0G3CC75_METBA|nr:cell surface protein [Methanosarcina barkeri CM1]